MGTGSALGDLYQSQANSFINSQSSTLSPAQMAALGMSNNTGSIYMGKGTPAYKEYTKGYAPTIPAEDKYLSYEEALNLPTTWSQKELDKFVVDGTMKKIPGFSANMGIDEVLAKWEDWVNLSQAQGARGNKMSPMDIYNSYVSREGATYKQGNWLYDAATHTPIKYVGPLSKTTTNTNVQEMSREDALALAKTTMAQMYGRSPTNTEVGSFLAALNSQARGTPQKTTTTTTINPETGEAENTSSVTTGGVSAAGQAALLEEKMKGTAEHAEYASSTTYYDAMMQLFSRGY